MMYHDVRVQVPRVNWSVLVWVINRLGVEYICGVDSPLCIVMADQDRLEWGGRIIFLSSVLVLILLERYT